MKSWKRAAGVGCGGLLGLTVLLAALGALVPAEAAMRTGR